MESSVKNRHALFDGMLTEAPLSRVNLCYQCKKCSCGCPINLDMDLLPHQVMRLLQLDDFPAVLSSQTIWVCAGCQTCSSRCPNDIDIAGVMDSCRHASFSAGQTSLKNIELFHRVFLDEIKRTGRVHELSMIARFKLLSGKWLDDLPMGAKMFFKGKLKIFPKRIKGRKELKKLFAETEQVE